MEILANHLREVREKRKMSKIEVARRAGVSYHSYRSYEDPNHGSDPSAEVLASIAIVLETSVDYLIGLSNSPMHIGMLNKLEYVKMGPEDRGIVDDLMLLSEEDKRKIHKSILEMLETK